MFVYALSQFAILRIPSECLDESASYLNVCDQKIGRRYEFKSIDTICSSVKGRLKGLCLTGALLTALSLESKLLNLVTDYLPFTFQL